MELLKIYPDAEGIRHQNCSNKARRNDSSDDVLWVEFNPAFDREIAAVSILDSDIQRLIHEQEQHEMGYINGLLCIWANEIRISDLQTASTLLYFTVEKVSHAIVFFDNTVEEEKLIKEQVDMLLRYLF